VAARSAAAGQGDRGPRAGKMMRSPQPKFRGWNAIAVDPGRASACGVVHCNMIGAGNLAERASMMRDGK